MQAVGHFLQAKGKADGVGSSTGPEAAGAVMDALHSLTSLRALLAAGLSSGDPQPPLGQPALVSPLLSTRHVLS